MYELLLPELEECKNRGCNVLGISHDIDNPMEGIEKHLAVKHIICRKICIGLFFRQMEKSCYTDTLLK